MKKLNPGFTLVELLISLVIATIVTVSVYRYWIKGVSTMTDSMKSSLLKGNAQQIFNNVSEDLKLIGYNPLGKLDPYNCKVSEDPCQLANRNSFGIITLSSPFDSIVYSFYNQNADPDYTATCTDTYCTRSQFFMVNGVFNKRYFDSVANTQQNMFLIGNACVRFILSSSRKSINFILAVAPTPELAQDQFTSSNTQCQIPKKDNINDPAYSRFEKTIYLENLH